MSTFQSSLRMVAHNFIDIFLPMMCLLRYVLVSMNTFACGVTHTLRVGN